MVLTPPEATEAGYVQSPRFQTECSPNVRRPPVRGMFRRERLRILTGFSRNLGAPPIPGKFLTKRPPQRCQADRCQVGRTACRRSSSIRWYLDEDPLLEGARAKPTERAKIDAPLRGRRPDGRAEWRPARAASLLRIRARAEGLCRTECGPRGCRLLTMSRGLAAPRGLDCACAEEGAL